MPIVLGLAAGLVGLLAGMLINALSDDLPGDGPVRPPHYPDGTPRPRIAWSGLLAFVTGHRRSPEGASLAWRQPLVEIGMIVLFVYIASAFPFSVRSIVWMVDLAILMLITVIDLETRMILYVVVLPAYVIALIGSALVGSLNTEPISFLDYLFGAAGGFLIFFAMYQGGRLFGFAVSKQRGEELEEEAFGFGDVLLATLCGLMIGWQAGIFALTLTVLLGAAGAILYVVARLIVKGGYEMLTPLPYGQYIVLGTMIMMLWREPLKAILQR